MTEFEVALQEHLENTLNPHSVIKAQVGLGNVDNTRDMDKPVSTLQEKRIVEIEAKALARDNTKPFTPTEPYHPATKEYVDNKASVAHLEDTVNTQAGAHGLRYHESKLEYFDGTQWKEIETGGGAYDTLPPQIQNLKVTAGNEKASLTWTLPEDRTDYAGLLLVRKEGSMPLKVQDGVELNLSMDAVSFEDTGLTNGTTYYYRVFPYNAKQQYQTQITGAVVNVTPKAFRVMGVQIDLSNSNPETAVTYTDDAVGMTPGSEAWDRFFGHRPCLFKDGTVVGYLNPNDFTQFEDGTPADIVSGNAGDVMIEFPRRGLVINTVGNILSVKMTDRPNDTSFAYLAHTRGTEQRDYFYLGAYKGFKDSANKIRSLSGKMPTVSQTIATFRTQARANGAGYENSGFYQVAFRQSMYILKYKNLNSQAVIGRGYVDGNTVAATTGGTEKRGMNWGESTGKQHMKLFGLEDFWGNVWEWVDGCITDGNRNILTATTGFNDAGIGYVNQGQGAKADIGGYMSKPQGTSETGYLAREFGGSATTYFCDYPDMSASHVCSFGGHWYDSSYTGAFRLYVNAPSSHTKNDLSARLMYL